MFALLIYTKRVRTDTHNNTHSTNLFSQGANKIFTQPFHPQIVGTINSCIIVSYE